MPDYILSLNIDGHPLGFNNSAEVISFVEEQIGLWSWVTVNPENNALKRLLSRHLMPKLEHISSLAKNVKLSKDTVDQFDGAFVSLREARVPIYPSPTTIYLDKLKENPEVAYAFLAAHFGLAFTASHAFHVKGLLLQILFGSGAANGLSEATSESLESLHLQYHSALQSLQALVEKNDALLVESLSDKNHLTLFMRRYARLSAFKLSSAADTKVSSAVKSIQETEKLYQEGMRLKAPVEYWSAKAAEHAEQAGRYKKYLLWYAPVATIASMLFIIVSPFFANLFYSSGNDPQAQVLFGLSIFVLLTALFWSGRVLTRLFLSQHHLSIDANERAVMAQTYLALTADGAAEAAERNIVLQSLFRPTADGIVKDDAAPDFSPSALASRFGSK